MAMDSPQGSDNVPDEDVAPVASATQKTNKPKKAKKVRFRRTRAFFAKIPHPPLKSKRGVFLIIFFSGLLATMVTATAYTAVAWTETASFCGRCHTMGPELKAYAMSPHSELGCAECHVKPGIGGWVEAKVKGTKQLVEVISGQYPTPIPPPDHAELPNVADTCMKCHSIDRISSAGGPVKLVLRPRYQLDEGNTKEMVAVVLRPAGLESDSITSQPGTSSENFATGTDGPKGVHWHVDQQVDYVADTPQAQNIPLVEYTQSDGTVVSYVSESEIGSPENANVDITRLKNADITRTMNCIDCHNRVGHGIPDTGVAVDDAIANGKISSTLPFIKRDAVELLNREYPTDAAANTAIEGLATTYATNYPLIAQNQAQDIQKAVTEVKSIYHELATPEMKVQAATYPDNLGHEKSPGCFRCHDGTHVKVVDGVATKEVIPSTCSTCHTFPQVGTSVTGLLLGSKPETHNEKLYVFSHKNAVDSVNAVFSSTNKDPKIDCASCHQRSYCENCHNSGAINVKHDDMMYNHALSVEKASATACAYCHQPVYCAKCHSDNVMPERNLSQVRTSEPPVEPSATP